jgi:hypothetical protein
MYFELRARAEDFNLKTLVRERSGDMPMAVTLDESLEELEEHQVEEQRVEETVPTGPSPHSRKRKKKRR